MHHHGSNQGNGGAAESDAIASHGREHSLSLTLPSLATIRLVRRRNDLTRGRGKPVPLGARLRRQGSFSAHAGAVELCVLDEQANEQRSISGVQRRHLATAEGSPPGRLRAGYRVHGPWDPAQAPLNLAKLLIDPSAHRVEGDLPDDERLHGGMAV